jgi:uncharacterized membrane protein YkvA (DUF1232 family)
MGSEQKSPIGAYILMGLSVLYGISPVDIIPDIPVVGWVDDFFVLGTAGFNLIEKQFGETNAAIKGIAKTLKWGMIILGVIAIALVLLLGAFIVSLFK